MWFEPGVLMQLQAIVLQSNKQMKEVLSTEWSVITDNDTGFAILCALKVCLVDSKTRWSMSVGTFMYGHTKKQLKTDMVYNV